MAKMDSTKTIVTSTIHVSEVTVNDGVPTLVALSDIIEVGTKALTPEKASKITNTVYKGKVVAVTSIETMEEVRGMSLETYITHSVPVVRPASQQKKA